MCKNSIVGTFFFMLCSVASFLLLLMVIFISEHSTELQERHLLPSCVFRCVFVTLNALRVSRVCQCCGLCCQVPIGTGND